jgi:hypothetical protein
VPVKLCSMSSGIRGVYCRRPHRAEVRKETAESECPVPQTPPARRIHFTAKFDGHRAEDQRAEEQYQSEVETAEDGRIDDRNAVNNARHRR